MDFGVTVPNFGKYADKNEIIKVTTTAEELGFDSIWVSDHIVIPQSHRVFGYVFYDPLVTLSYLASVTQTIKLGISVVILPYRNPVVLAKMISTLDQLSEGRIILGVGTGWLKEEFDALGYSYDQRGKITDEYIEILKALWTEDLPKYDGEFHSFSGIRFLPKPHQKPYPPIWVGGGSVKAIERAVISGDGWHPVGLTPGQIKDSQFLVKKLFKTHKKDDFVISLRRNLQITEKDIDEDDTLRGSLEKVVSGLRDYKKTGVDHLILNFLSGTSDGVINAMRHFSMEIRPHI